MEIKVCKTREQLGQQAADFTADVLNRCIREKGKARIVLSTGGSQTDTIKALVKADVDWSKVEVFHLDEYINLPDSHPASFRKWLKERFLVYVTVKKAYFVNVEGDVKERIAEITNEMRKEPIDIALIGIGENSHIAFNDPPADFNTKEAYIVVDLAESCKQQQVREGWYPSIADVPKQAVSMTVHQIMQSKVIVSPVPYKVKSRAVKLTLENNLTDTIPSTMLKEHSHFYLFLDEDSSSEIEVKSTF